MCIARPGGRRIAVLAVALVTEAGLTACSGAGDGSSGSGATALPTAAPTGSSLLCGMVPRRSVAVALDRPTGTLEATGQLTTDKATGHVTGSCRIASTATAEPALSVEIIWPSTEAADLVRSLIGRGTPYTFPDSFAPGVAFYDGPGTDVESQAVARVVWGDYVVSVTDREPAPDRSALEDSVALVHEVIDAVDLAPQPAT